MPEFVFNRTQRHVERLKSLQKKGYTNLTKSELEEYHGYASLGAYNCTDVNRVVAATREVGAMYGLTIPDRTLQGRRPGVTYETLPIRKRVTESGSFSMGYYLDDVKSVRDAALAQNSALKFPTLPENMDALTWETANNIEKTLYVAYSNLTGATIIMFVDAESGKLAYKVTISGVHNENIESIVLLAQAHYPSTGNSEWVAITSIPKENHDTVSGHTYDGEVSMPTGDFTVGGFMARLKYTNAEGNSQTIDSNFSISLEAGMSGSSTNNALGTGVLGTMTLGQD